MSPPLVSVIIPAYDQAPFLPEAIQSVLDQSYAEVELVVVNDASPDDTDAVMMRLTDPRITYLVHERNLGVAAARNTGIRASRGEILAFLDADDYFHPRKLEAHVQFLAAHPETGASYNARFELNHSSRTIREMWRPPPTVTLTDLVVGFPFSPSDLVVRRDWAFAVGLFDPAMQTAEDTDFPCRLMLAGCRFAGIDRALNYRRFHSGRPRQNLAGWLADAERAVAAVLADPRCPEAVRALGRRATKYHLLAFAGLALIQNETALAQDWLRELVRADPGIVCGAPGELVEYLLQVSLADESLDHAAVLQAIFAQIPSDLPSLSPHYGWCVGRGYVWKAIRATMWGREDAARRDFSRAAAVSAGVDETLLRQVTHGLLGYLDEFGADATAGVLGRLRLHLNALAPRAGDRLEACYLVNRAFRHYRAGEWAHVPGTVVRAWRRDASHLMNRGVRAIFVRSWGKIIRSGFRRGEVRSVPADECR